MRLLNGDEISTILRNLTPEDATRLLESLSSGLAVYTAEKYSNGQTRLIHQPLRTVIQTKDQNLILTMPVSNTSITSVKVATVSPKEGIKGAITIYSDVGDLLGVLNAAQITAFRTALATMTILTRWRAPIKVNFVVFGAGKQAEWHIRLALLLLSGVRDVTVVNRGKARLEKFEHDVLREMKRSYPNVQFSAIAQEENSQYQEQLSQKLKESHIICCCTPSAEPLFTAEILKSNTPQSGRFLSLIGSYKPEMQEADTETIKLGGKIWVDSKEACAEEAGELIRAGLGEEDLVEIGELFSSDGEAKQKLEPGSALTVFKCVGFGLMDLVVAKALLNIAEELGTGTVFDKF